MIVYVVNFHICVYWSLPKCALKGALLVVVFGMISFFCIVSAILSASEIFDHLVSLFSIDNLFIVCIRRSIKPAALWLPAGASFKFIL